MPVFAGSDSEGKANYESDYVTYIGDVSLGSHINCHQIIGKVDYGD